MCADGTRVQVDYRGAEDLDACPVPPVWSAAPPIAAALGLADALRGQQLWTTARASGVNGGGDSEAYGAPSLVELAPASDEFRAVAAHFYAASDAAADAAIAGALPWRVGVRVESVLRVENGTLRELYLARRAHVARQCGACGAKFDPVRMERWVFHGPATGSAHGDALGSIVEEGFFPLLAGSLFGGKYGQGVGARVPGCESRCARARVGARALACLRRRVWLACVRAHMFFLHASIFAHGMSARL